MTRIEVSRDVRAENLRRAERLGQSFTERNLRVIGLLGSPGAGKTTLLEHLLPQLQAERRVAVIEGDVATDNDARRIERIGATAVQINTGGACHLDADMVERALGRLDLERIDLLIIENVGNLICPVSFPLGEAVRLAVISVAEGEDKPLKYPGAILHTDAVVLTKTDLAALVRVDPARMAEHVRSVNPRARVFYAGFAGDALETRPADGKGSLGELLLG